MTPQDILNATANGSWREIVEWFYELDESGIREELDRVFPHEKKANKKVADAILHAFTVYGVEEPHPCSVL